MVRQSLLALENTVNCLFGPFEPIWIERKYMYLTYIWYSHHDLPKDFFFIVLWKYTLHLFFAFHLKHSKYSCLMYKYIWGMKCVYENLYRNFNIVLYFFEDFFGKSHFHINYLASCGFILFYVNLKYQFMRKINSMCKWIYKSSRILHSR